MTHVLLRVDESARIGREIVLSPTDVEAAGVRLRARGRAVGGANDGESFDAFHELSVGQSVHLGPLVAVTLIGVRGPVATLGVFAPPNLRVSVDGA